MTDNLISLSDLILLQRGFDLPSDKRIDGSYPVVASTGINGYHNDYKVKGAGVVIGRSGSIGGGQYINSDYWPLNTTLWVKDFRGHDKKYIFYLLLSINFERFNAGSGVPTLNRNHLDCIEVIKRSNDEESNISYILSSFDNKIDLLRKQNKTLENIAQTLFKRWFVEFDFPDKDGKPYKSCGGKMVTSELGEIPEGWEAKPIYNIAEFINGAAFKPTELNDNKEGLPVIKITELKNSITSQTKWSTKTINDNLIIDSGDILFSWSGSPETSIDIFIWAVEKGKLNQHTFKVNVPNTEKGWVYFQLKYLKNRNYSGL